MGIIEQIIDWDVRVLLYIQDVIRSAALTPIMKVITYSGNAGIIWMVICALLLMFKKTRRIGFIAAMALLCSYLVNNILLKNLIARVRPYEAIPGLFRVIGKQSDWSFPSGHAASAFSTAGGIFFAAKRKWIPIPLLLYAGLIAFSRLYVGVHYPSDVIAGALSGFLISLIVYRVIHSIEVSREKKRQEKEDMDALMV